MSITIKQIAEKAGVSRAAVDKVLHNRPGISDEVRQRVKKIAEENNYVPNQFARALKNKDKELIFAVITTNPDKGVFSKALSNGMIAAENELKGYGYGVKLEFHYTDAIDDDEFEMVLKKIDKSKIHGLAIRAQSKISTRKYINSLVDLGKPVVTFDTDISNCKRMFFIGEDNVSMGRTAGDLLAKCCGGKGKVAVLIGAKSMLGHRLRSDGFANVIGERYPEITIVDRVNTDEDIEKEYRATKKLLDDNDDLSGIFLAAGRIKGMIDAVKESGRNIKLVECSCIEESLPYLREGAVDFGIGQLPFEEGKTTIFTLLNIIYNYSLPSHVFIKIPANIYTRENIDI